MTEHSVSRSKSEADICVGDDFDRLTVKAHATRSRTGRRRFVCSCSCGRERIVQAAHLLRGNVRSCGCLQIDVNRRLKFRHGATIKHTPEYRSWCAMNQRCANPRDIHWKWYGGRGITVCDQWRKSYETFLADMGSRLPGLTLDRIDSNKNYEPGNCRWADSVTQRRNQRRYRAHLNRAHDFALAELGL